MLGGEDQVALPSGLAPKPTYGETFASSVVKPFEEVAQLKDYIFPGQSTEDGRRATAGLLANINETLSDPRQGLGQHASNFVGSTIGTLIPTLPFGFVGGIAAKGVAGAIGYGLEEAALGIGSEGALSAYLGTQVPLKTLAEGTARHFLPGVSAAAIGTGLAEAYGSYKTFTIPEHFAENYNAINNSLDTSHAIQDWGADNYGFLLGAAPLAAGYIAFKGVRGVIAHRAAKAESKALDAELTRLFKQHDEVLAANAIKEGETKAQQAERQAQVSELQDHLQQAEELGHITPAMHEWYLEYLENPNDMTKVHEGGLEILKSLQIPYDRATGKVWHEIIGRDNVQNLKSALFDQGITNFSEEENQLLSTYIIHTALGNNASNLRNQPALLAAIQGYAHNLGLKIAKNSDDLKAFDLSLSRLLPKGIKKKLIFSQQNILQHLKKIGVFHGQAVPYTLPSNIRRKLKLHERIKKIESRSTAKYEREFQAGRHLELKALEKDIKLMHPADELMHLRNELMPESKLINDFKNSTDYHRLEDLSQVWPEAKVLLDRIHMEFINAKQKALNEILKKFTDMVDVSASRLAHPDSVKRYLHSRIEKAVPIVKRFDESGVRAGLAIDEKMVTPEVIFDESSTQKVKSSDLDFAKEQFEASEMKFKQFSASEQALSDLITCQFGE